MGLRGVMYLYIMVTSMSLRGSRGAVKTPVKYQGQWVAWNYEHTKVVASGESPLEVKEKAIKKGEPRPWLDKVPAENEYYGGAAALQ